MFKKKKLLVSFFLSGILFTSCEFFNPDLKGFLKEYTETAAIEKIEYSLPVQKDKAGNLSVASSDDLTCTLYMRNPQDYSLVMNYHINTDLEEIFSSVIQDEVDKKKANFKISKLQLEQCEKNDTRDISGFVTIYHPKTGRNFAQFPISLFVNSLPPAVEKPMLQLTSESNGQYVLCFYMPVVAASVHENDTFVIQINDKTRYFDKTGTRFYKDPEMTVPDEDFLSAAPVLYPLQADSPKFEDTSEPDGELAYKKCYYLTNDNFSEQEKTYDITILDKAGFEAKSGVSNKPYKLDEVTFGLENNSVVSTEDESGTFAVQFMHSGMAGEKYCGEVEVVYTVTKEGTPYKSGTLKVSDTEPGNVHLPTGKNYKITAYAKRNYFVASDNTDVTFNISRSGVYYISQNGTSTALGTKADPFRTIQQAINDIDVQITDFGILDEGYTINLLTDITPDESDTFADNALVKIPTKSMNIKYTFNGVNGVKKIDAQRDASHKGKIFTLDCPTGSYKTQLIMNNLILTGGYADSNGGAVQFAASFGGYFIADFNNVTFDGNIVNNVSQENGGGAIYFDGGYNNYSVLTLNKCLVQNNSALGKANGGAIYTRTSNDFANGTIHIKNTRILNNTCEESGSVIYYKNNLILENTTITGNTCKTGGAVCNGDLISDVATLKISGKNTITGNKLLDDSEANIWLGKYTSGQLTISVTGSLSGSKIGVSSADAPTVGHSFVFTTGYSDYNSGVTPSTYFVGDNFTVISDNGEAALAVGGGLISKEIYEDVKFELDRTNVYYDLPEDSWRTINVKAKLDGEEITLSSIKLKLLNKGDLVKESSTNTIVVDRDFLFDDTYVLQVEGVYKGTSYRGNFDISYTKGDNFLTLTEPPTSGSYNIGSVESFEKFGNMVNSGAKFDNVELYLQKDIVLPENFEMIGGASQSATNKFHGVLDGNGHSITIRSVASGTTSIFGLVEKKDTVIRNIVIEGEVTTSGDFYGLCNYLDTQAKIENCINRCKITSTNGKAAGFAGSGNNSAVFINCRNEADISGKNYVGGLVAECSNAKFDGCVNTGNITATGNYAGGITGKLFGSIVNSVNTGNVQAQNYVGGICGHFYTTSGNGDGIVNCYNSGSVVATTDYAGGILGDAGSDGSNSVYHYAFVKNCFNTGSVLANDSSTAYGIIGHINSNIETYGVFTNNYYLSGCVPTGQSGCHNIDDSTKFDIKTTKDEAVTSLNSWISSNTTFKSYVLKQWRLVDGIIVLGE